METNMEKSIQNNIRGENILFKKHNSTTDAQCPIDNFQTKQTILSIITSFNNARQHNNEKTKSPWMQNAIVEILVNSANNLLKTKYENCLFFFDD